MNNNPIDELRNMKIPVSEQEWESIVRDKRYVKKFGKRSGLSPKGRTALIAGATAVIITIPILVKTLSHKATDAAQGNQTEIQITEKQINSNTASITAPTEKQSPAVVHQSEATPKMLPSASNVTVQAATQEQSTLTAVTEARVTSTNLPVQTTTTAVTSPSTIQPSNNINTPTEKPSKATVKENKKSDHGEPDNSPQIANNLSDDNWPTQDKNQDETEPEPEVTDEDFFIPTAFTPNGDNLNDYFFVKANFIPRSFEMSILNRNGDLVFYSRDIECKWDGKKRGQTLPGGVYVCIITYTDRDGETQKRQRQVLLLP